MYRGTTPIIDLEVNVDTSLLEEVYVTFKQGSEVKFEKNLELCTVCEDKLQIQLSQEETLSLTPGILSLQMRAKLNDGTVIASDPFTILVEDVYKDGVI